MGTFLVRRGGQAILVLVGVSIASFLVLHLTPGDPVRAALGPRATPESVAALRQQLGLDRSVLAQYWSFLTGAVQFDFGRSIISREEVSRLISLRLGSTLFLTIYATVLSALIAVPLALLSATRRNRATDHAVRLTTMVTLVMPPFWLGLLLILGFAIELRLFPPSGYGSGFLDHLYHLTLPALALGLGMAPLVLRTLRTELIETMGTEFVEAARSRGLSERRIMYRYVLRNSLVGSLTVLGVTVGYVLGGAVVIENVFALPGLGSMLVVAVQNRDFPIVEALAILFGALVVFINLATDLLYAAIDPRVRL